MLYRYTPESNNYTTYTAILPDNAVDHGLMPDGFVYVAFTGLVPDQPVQVELNPVQLTKDIEAMLRDNSPQFLLLNERITAGLYIDDTNHVVPGDSAQLAEFRKSQEAKFLGI